MFGFDAQHTGFNSFERLLSPANVSQLNLAWTSPSIGADYYSSPMVSGGTVYVGSYDGRVYAFDVATGQTRWVSEPHPGTITGVNLSTPAVVNGVVYICLHDSRLYAFDAATGRLRWVSPAENAVISSPTVVNGVVYVTGNENVYAFDAASGRPLWASSSIGAGYPALAVANGIVYVNISSNSPGTGRIAALNAATGQLRWRSDLITGGIDTNASLTVANGLIYIGVDGGLAAFDAQTGRLRWITTPAKGTTGSTTAAANDLVYLSIDRVYAFDAATGKLRWTSNSMGSYIANSPFVANGVLYVCGNTISSSWVNALDAATGRTLWTSSLAEEQTGTPPIVENGMVYVASGNRDVQIYAFHLPRK